ncbi:hypothetical protein SAMN06295967_1251, partial [Belliella buryatensis]
IKISANFFKKSTFKIFIDMKKIIITENQLQKLSKFIRDKNVPVKTHKLNLINIVQNHEKTK